MERGIAAAAAAAELVVVAVAERAVVFAAHDVEEVLARRRVVVSVPAVENVADTVDEGEYEHVGVPSPSDVAASRRNPARYPPRGSGHHPSRAKPGSLSWQLFIPYSASISCTSVDFLRKEIYRRFSLSLSLLFL